MSGDEVVMLGKKEVNIIKDAALTFWKETHSEPAVEGEKQRLETMAFIEGTIVVLNRMGLLKKLPKFKYTHKR
jgi:hypothetical protein